MSHTFFRLVLGLGLVGAAQAAPITAIDDAGNTITLARPAQRVISLAPSLTEVLYAAGGGKALIGAVEYSDYPPEATKVPRIGSNRTLDLERIAALKPDLALVWFHGNAQREIERLRALKIPMFYVEPHHMPEIADDIERIGILVGSSQMASTAAARFRQRYAILQKTYSQRTPVRVFYQVAEKPLLTINDQQLISDAIRLCGGINVFGKEPMLVPQLSTESVVAANPDIILTARMGGAADGSTAPQRKPDEPSLQRWAAFLDLTAVRHAQLWLIPGDQISRHGPRILDGTQAICTALDSARSRQ
jgi:iron complex transport system substrate-binding protein